MHKAIFSSPLVRLVDDGERDAESEALEVANLLGELDDLGQEVDLEPQLAALARLGALMMQGGNSIDIWNLGCKTLGQVLGQVGGQHQN